MRRTYILHNLDSNAAAASAVRPLEGWNFRAVAHSGARLTRAFWV